MLVNPFHELYIGDTATDEGFVDLFSPVLLKHVAALYRPGHTALVGSQGNGKSMLLGLLRPEVRLAYDKKHQRFPLAKPYSTFIGAGINIIQSAAKDFAQRIEGNNPHQVLPLYFGDFLNYWIIQDLLASLILLTEGASRSTLQELGMQDAAGRLDECAKRVAQDGCWIGFLDGVDSIQLLRERIDTRLNIYRDYLNFNLDELPRSIRTSTTSVGEPLSRFAQTMRECNVIGNDTNIFVRIDQLDSLLDLGGNNEDFTAVLRSFRQVINKFLGQRSSLISYKVGVRPAAWKSEMRIYGTPVNLELNRDYVEVDLDRLLQRRENTRTWVFRIFAEDMFKRRLIYSKLRLPASEDLLMYVLGRGIRPTDISKVYQPRARTKLISINSAWQPAVKAAVESLNSDRPLEAKLLDAWVRQKGDGEVGEVVNGRLPWDSKPYWRKERIQQALLQIAAQNKQRLLWSGKEDVIQLSGYNVLSLLRLYRGIWDSWLQESSDSRKGVPEDIPHSISAIVQSAGIDNASDEWHEKLTDEPGSDLAMRFADVLGVTFRQKLRSDLRMSNPGFNGFSVLVDDLNADSEVKAAIENASAFAVLSWQKHTSKNSEGGLRRKYYVNALLSPFYQIPARHTKEPEYVSIQQVRAWLIEAGLLKGVATAKGKVRGGVHQDGPNAQGGLFG